MENFKVISGLFIRIAGAALAFLINLSAVRFLGVENSSGFFYFLTLTSVFSAVFTLGFYNLVQSKGSILSCRLYHSFIQLSVYLVPVNLFLLLAIGFLIGLDFYLVIAASISCFPLSIITVYSGFTNKAGSYFKSVLYQNIAVQFTFLVFLTSAKYIYVDINAHLAVSLYLMSAFVVVLPCLFGFRYKAVRFRHFLYLFKSTLPFLIVIVSAQLYMWGINFTSMYSLAKEEYSALVIIQRVAFSIAIIISVIDAVASPSFNRAYRDDKIDDLILLMKKFTLTSLVIGSVIFVFLLLFDEFILSLFSEYFIIYKSELIFICVSQLINCITGPTGSFLMMTGNQQIYKKLVFKVSITTVFCSLPLGVFFGLQGVVLIVFLSSIFQNILCVYYVKKKFGFLTFNPFRF